MTPHEAASAAYNTAYGEAILARLKLADLEKRVKQ